MIIDSDKKTKLSLQAELLGLTVFGKLIAFDEDKQPVVIADGDSFSQKQLARSCVKLSRHHLGCEIVLLMVGGNKPVILGVIESAPVADQPEKDEVNTQPQQAIKLDGNVIELNAKNKLSLRCGDTRITLTKQGKVEIKGKYILSRAKKAQRIQGGSVELN